MISIEQAIGPDQNNNDRYLLGGRPKVFATPDGLWDAACSYFEYAVKNPIPYYVVRYRKIVVRYAMRAMSLKGLYLNLGVQDLRYYKKSEEFSEVIERIKQVIYIHNFTGAAAGLLKGKVVGWTLR